MVLKFIQRLLGGGDRGSEPPGRVPPPPPDPDRFWAIIAQTVGTPQDQQAEALDKALSGLSPEALVAFDADYRRALRAAYRWDLWAAAYVINGGASDDGFDYFCDWLISRGRGPYEAALADPARLISVVNEMDDDEEAEFEEFRYVVQDRYEEATGEAMPFLDMGDHPDEPAGEPWDEDDVDDMYPELAAWANER